MNPHGFHQCEVGGDVELQPTRPHPIGQVEDAAVATRARKLGVAAEHGGENGEFRAWGGGQNEAWDREEARAGAAIEGHPAFAGVELNK